ncbi:MAG: S8 family serine peptidase, partial [Planctomycetes bacterium]|nr:S8 family serine peptidase [Planctomycetota bacterium]
AEVVRGHLDRAGVRRPASRVFEATEADLEGLAVRKATPESPLPRLDLYLEVPCPSPETARALLGSLRADPRVEAAYLPSLPPPSPAAGSGGSSTPDFNTQQGYLGGYTVPITGLNIRPLWDMPGGTGDRVRFGDIEYNWNLAHEDLAGARSQLRSTIELLGPAPTVPPWFGAADWARETQHGTAVLGLVLGQQNAFGMLGIAPSAWAYVFASYVTLPSDVTPPPPASYDTTLALAVRRAADAFSAGDVALIEAQIGGPRWNGTPTSQIGVLPVEWSQVVFDAVRYATAKGVIVVEAAGNGSQDLDDPIYQRLFDRTFRDSGAILVTGYASNINMPASAAPYLNRGSRVDFNGWGDSVVTLGYGDLYQNGPNALRSYTATFGASSAASAMVAGGIVSLQGIGVFTSNRPFDAATLRAAMTATGYTNGSLAGSIGMRPNFGGAVSALGISGGAIVNPSFERTWVRGNDPYDWGVDFSETVTASSLGTIQPTHRSRFLQLAAGSNGRPVVAVSPFTVPHFGRLLSADWYLLSTRPASGAPCGAVKARIWLEDPRTSETWPLAGADDCEAAADSSVAGYPTGTGWRTSQTRDLAPLRGRSLELRAEVVAKNDPVGPRAILLLDNVRFRLMDLAPPTLASIQPSSGTVCGGTRVRVTGANFTAGDTVVTIGGNALENVLWIDTRTIAGDTPRGSSAGSAVVEVRNGQGSGRLAATFTYTDATCPDPRAEVSLRRGDCNDDGTVDLSDAVAALSFLFAGAQEPACEKACDTNDDGGVDISDPIAVLNYLFSGGKRPADPFPACGPDPTEDALTCEGGESCS